MSWIFEEDPKKPAPIKPAPKPAPPAYTVPGVQPYAQAAQDLVGTAGAAGAGSGTTYDRLLARTDFNSTAECQTLEKYLVTLASVIPDEKTRYKAAAKLASQEGVSTEKILATFEGLKVALRNEVTKFNSAGSAEDGNIAQKQEQIRQLSIQMSQLQSQITTLGGEVSDSRNRIDSIKTEFNSAVNRRSLELDKEKERYTQLLR